MEKTGRRRIRKDRNRGLPAVCMNCGAEGEYRVTYEDLWGKLTVTLCTECEKLNYEKLKLQSRFDWPIEALKA